MFVFIEFQSSSEIWSSQLWTDFKNRLPKNPEGSPRRGLQGETCCEWVHLLGWQASIAASAVDDYRHYENNH
jgi:hypothetical protein